MLIGIRRFQLSHLCPLAGKIPDPFTTVRTRSLLRVEEKVLRYQTTRKARRKLLVLGKCRRVTVCSTHRGVSPRWVSDASGVGYGGEHAGSRSGLDRESSVPLQAIPLALIASLYPFGIAALFLLFQATRPRARAGAFLAGAAVCTLTVGFLFVFVLRNAGDNQNSQGSPRYGLELGIGIAFLIGALVISRHVPKPKSDNEPSRIKKAASGSGLLAVFGVGIAMYTPSPTYLAALEVISSSKLSAAAESVWVILVVLLLLITIEIPILFFLLAPGWTVPRLSRLNDWLARNGRELFVVVLVVLGAWEVMRGLVGLL